MPVSKTLDLALVAETFGEPVAVASMEEFGEPKYTRQISKIELLPAAQTRVINVILDVPLFEQSGNVTCWAASASAVGYYLTGDVIPDANLSYWIHDSYNHSGDDLDVCEALGYFTYPDSSTTIHSLIISGSMGDGNIRSWVDNGIPVIAHLKAPNVALGHDVVVCGYWNGSSGGQTVTIMNPWTGSYEEMRKNSSGVPTSGSMAWDYSSIAPVGWQKPYGGSYWSWVRGDGTRERGWLQLDGEYYWFDSNGCMAEKEWVKLDGKWYYLGGAGVMETGWLSYNGYWYYLGSDGAARTGWNSIDGYWYAFDGNGAMYRGWYQDGSTWYYLRTANGTPSGGPEGSMLASGTWTINGKAYKFDSSGTCLNP